MKNKTMPVWTVLIAAALLFPACNKDEVKTRREMLVGSWTIVKTAHDDNNNGVADDSELRAVAETTRNIETFFDDGTGVIIIKNELMDATTYFQWQLVNEEQSVQITPEGQTSTTVRLLTLSETDLVTENNSNPDGKDWIYARRK
jgi:hypothetical protein